MEERGPLEHELKTWPAFYESVRDGRKTFEVRHDDRDFREGDVLVLREHNPVRGRYTNRRPLRMLVTYLMRGGQFGLAEDYVVMALRPDEGDPARFADPR